MGFTGIILVKQKMDHGTRASFQYENSQANEQPMMRLLAL
jgi:hypothetical protein